MYMSKPLSPTVIKKRMVEWRNLKRLYPELRGKYDELKRENRELRRELAAVKRESATRIEALELQVEELRRMVFGRKRERSNDTEHGGGGAAPPHERQPRTPSSFRRTTPPPEAVTGRASHPLSLCPDCRMVLTRKEVVVRFVEDIPLPKKTVIEQSIERGFCPRCRKTKSALPISSQRCTLGPNVRLYVLFAITVLGQTFEKVKLPDLTVGASPDTPSAEKRNPAVAGAPLHT